MAEINQSADASGSVAKVNFGFVGRTSKIQGTGGFPAAKWNKIKDVDGTSGIDYWATGSAMGASAFTIVSAGNLTLSGVEGGIILASTLTGSSETHEIGLSRVSGSGQVILLYK